jgi:regulator of protease activity HflC (stomatin/prohibitin superfamily)
MGCCCCVCVKESQIGFIESFGKFDKVAPPGIHLICCCSQSLVGTLSLRQEQYKIEVETRSKDNVFIKIHLAAQVKIASTASEFNFYQQQRKEKNSKYLPRTRGEEEILLEQQSPHPGAALPIDLHKDAGMLYNAYYRLDRPIEQILAYVEEYFRFHGMEYSLDDMFAAKNDMTLELQEILNQKLNPYGYIICNILVLDIDPAEKVKNAMNDIIACEKEKRAQQSRAEADKITKILAAEAEARTRELAGEGIANARKAILNGLQTSVENFQQALPGSDPNQILKTVLMTQYLDTIKEAALTGRNTFVMPSSPAQILNIEEQLRAAIGVPANPPPQKLF